MQKHPKHMRGTLSLTLTILLLALLFTGVAAAENTTEIAPVVKLTFASVPENAIAGAEINVTVAATPDSSTKTALKSLTENVDNAAYQVTLTPKGFTAADITGLTVRLPVSSNWTGAHKNISAAVITGGKAELVPVTLIGINEKEQILFEAELKSLPDTVVLVSTTTAAAPPAATTVPVTTAATTAAQTTSAPEATQTPVPAAALITLFAAAGLTLRRRV